MNTPDGVSENDFRKALQEFANIVGSEWVFTSPEAVSLYRDVYSIYKNEPEEPVVPAAVAPDTAEEVQAVVKDCMAQAVIIGATNRSLPGKNNTLCFSPALIATQDDIDQIIDAVDGALTRVFG